jgi:hypothetical protein
MDTNKLNKKNLTKWTKRTPQRGPKKSSKKKFKKHRFELTRAQARCTPTHQEHWMHTYAGCMSLLLGVAN